RRCERGAGAPGGGVGERDAGLHGRMLAMTHQNLMAEPTPPATFLPEDVEAAAALAEAKDPRDAAAKFPAYCAAWAVLAEQALPADPVTAYAYARTGYHRGL